MNKIWVNFTKKLFKFYTCFSENLRPLGCDFWFDMPGTLSSDRHMADNQHAPYIEDVIDNQNVGRI